MKSDRKLQKYSLNIKADDKKLLFDDISHLITPEETTFKTTAIASPETGDYQDHKVEVDNRRGSGGAPPDHYEFNKMQSRNMFDYNEESLTSTIRN